MSVSVPNVVLHNGAVMPMIGLGTWRSPQEVVTQVIKDAIEMGYKHFDCAHIYANEKQVGVALEDKLNEGVVKREELFITSKLWSTFHHPDLVRGACETTLQNLRLDYLDLYLIHWPMAFQEGEDLYPKDKNGRFIASNVDYLDTWRAMETLVDAGLCRAIGLSNFSKRQIERVLNIARIPPAVIQIECHPYFTQKPLIEFCRSKGMVITAYSPLGSGHTPYEKSGEFRLMEHPKVLEIAQRHDRNTAQVLIRYQTQRNHVVIPRSITKSHMAANLNVFDFELSGEEVDELNSMDINGRFMKMAAAFGHPQHPFESDEF